MTVQGTIVRSEVFLLGVIDPASASAFRDIIITIIIIIIFIIMCHVLS